MIRSCLLVFMLSLLPVAAWATECAGVSVDICFRPGAIACTPRIVAAIDSARTALLVQAYNFTAPTIIQAIGRAKARGVDVRVILDKSNRQPRYIGATYLRNAAVPLRIDDKVTIAHNKIIVIDSELTVGGSYNYSGSAESRNAENVTFTRSACVASKFAANFEDRWTKSAQ